MAKTLSSAVGMVLLVSSFAVAGKTSATPRTQPSVTTSQSNQTQAHGKKHHKQHHKPHKKASQG
jgi:hypothetical protein